MILEAMKSAAVSALVSSVISGVGVFYLQRYLNDKHRESEQRAAEEEQKLFEQEQLAAHQDENRGGR